MARRRTKQTKPKRRNPRVQVVSIKRTNSAKRTMRLRGWMPAHAVRVRKSGGRTILDVLR